MSTPTSDVPQDAPDGEIEITDLECSKMDFQRTVVGSSPEGEEEVRVEMGLEVSRFGMRRIGVQLMLRIPTAPGFRIEVAYRAVFTLDDLIPEPEVEDRLQWVASPVAPGILYPYLREAVSSTIGRARLKPVVLPLINPQTLFSDKEIMIPAFEPGPPEALST